MRIGAPAQSAILNRSWSKLYCPMRKLAYTGGVNRAANP